MWESPSWIGPAITAKVKLKSDRESRAMTEDIADLDRAAALERARIQAETSYYASNTSAAIAEADRVVRQKIADADRTSRELIAANELVSRQTIADKQVASNEKISELNRALTASENAKQREWQSAENQLERANKLEVAGIQASANVAGQGVRLIPFFVGKTGNNNNNTNSSGTSTSLKKQVPFPATAAENATKSEAKKRADDLFPDLEPTFTTQTSVLNKVAPSTLAGLATLVVGTMLTTVPFI